MRGTGRGAGEYNDLATIQRNNATTTDDGQLAQKWERFGKEWLQVVPRGGRERRLFEQLRPEVTHIVRGRFNSQMRKVKPANFRFVFEDEGITLNISSKINVDGRNVEYQFECIEVQQ